MKKAMPFNKISVIGLGYIGLPTAAIFASRKVQVIGVEIDEETVKTINKGGIHIVEPDLDIVVRSVVTDGYLRATLTPEPAEAFLIAVPTPFKGDNHEPDLKYIEAASNAIAPVLEKGNIVILESTSPVGATEQMSAWLAEARPDLTFPQTDGENSDIRIAHCPERVLPGQVLRELVENDRVIGGMTDKCSKMAVSLYKTFVKGNCVVTNARTAEMVKLTENSFRDVNIAFANELSIICEKLDISVWELIELANRHPRVNVLQPGPGVGGHCIAVDPWFIINKTPEVTNLIRTAREVNDSKPAWVINKCNESIGKHLMQNPEKSAKDVKIACYGITFKPNIDDLRESPALDIVNSIAESHSGDVIVVEPNIGKLPHNMPSNIQLGHFGQVDADVHILLVDHKEFKDSKRPDGEIVDTRGIWLK